MQKKHIFIPILEIVALEQQSKEESKTKTIKFKTTPGFLKKARGS
jgi:hypothetical protein